MKKLRKKELTPTEQLYLDALQTNPDGVSQADLAGLKPSSALVQSNLVQVHIKNLRAKLPPGKELVTVRGWGYRLITKKV